ncbi:hypothetical protein CC78DRAFT_582596 [Lojkania enalia]|uniref:Uncharacterized protein n=1 Tax=Lojkania enalia TaxID=147567 RepID=A0A9P4K4J3_9PLEO|nr:hypothetical protein CC78DRAFT_582596 [Didymosphaeria enalia]
MGFRPKSQTQQFPRNPEAAHFSMPASQLPLTKLPGADAAYGVYFIFLDPNPQIPTDTSLSFNMFAVFSTPAVQTSCAEKKNRTRETGLFVYPSILLSAGLRTALYFTLHGNILQDKQFYLYSQIYFSRQNVNMISNTNTATNHT